MCVSILSSLFSLYLHFGRRLEVKNSKLPHITLQDSGWASLTLTQTDWEWYVKSSRRESPEYQVLTSLPAALRPLFSISLLQSTPALYPSVITSFPFRHFPSSSLLRRLASFFSHGAKSNNINYFQRPVSYEMLTGEIWGGMRWSSAGCVLSLKKWHLKNKFQTAAPFLKHDDFKFCRVAHVWEQDKNKAWKAGMST